MTLEDLESCRKVAQKLFGLQHELRVMKKNAGYIRSVSYTDVPRTRGEPLSPEQAHVEKCEEKEIEIADAKSILDPLLVKLRRSIVGLPEIQYKLIWYYYGCGLKWDEVNAKISDPPLKRRTSQYYHKQALKKIFKNT